MRSAGGSNSFSGEASQDSKAGLAHAGSTSQCHEPRVRRSLSPAAGLCVRLALRTVSGAGGISLWFQFRITIVRLPD